MPEFKWFGHNCFRIKSREATVITDPVDRSTGFAMAKQNASIVTISNYNASNANLGVVRPEFQTVDGPGEYELENIFVTGVRTFLDAQRHAEKAFNTAYLFEVDGFVICHLGDIGQPPTAEQTQQLAQADILLIPVGGGTGLTQEHAAEVVSVLEPKVLIPMQYQTPIGDRSLQPLDTFAKLVGVELPEPLDKYAPRQADLQDAMEIVLLNPDSEAVRR
ncbi:MAG: MBL fold metallo-hydrolase [Thermomicrobiales bacterium]|nr:MBL fold metallo-hydrolase [Thermomicrobiales bacterium]MCO5221922.1 MBL fold metallo-hydrolase [Thermomicrobiales bacterium]